MNLRIKAGERLVIGPGVIPGPASSAGQALIRDPVLDPGSEAGVTSKPMEIQLEAGAELDLVRINLADTEPRKENWRIILAGERASCSLSFLDLAKNSAEVSSVVDVIHQAPNCKSVQLHKGIYADKSRGVMRANIQVPKNAIGTDASQLHRSLLLSSQARIQAEPHLQIDTDEVQCRHGASIGHLDEQALFYLKTRGLSEDLARKMLIQAFSSEVLEKIHEQSEQDKWKEQVFAWI